MRDRRGFARFVSRGTPSCRWIEGLVASLSLIRLPQPPRFVWCARIIFSRLLFFLKKINEEKEITLVILENKPVCWGLPGDVMLESFSVDD